MNIQNLAFICSNSSTFEKCQVFPVFNFFTSYMVESSTSCCGSYISFHIYFSEHGFFLAKLDNFTSCIETSHWNKQFGLTLTKKHSLICSFLRGKGDKKSLTGLTPSLTFWHAGMLEYLLLNTYNCLQYTRLKPSVWMCHLQSQMVDLNNIFFG